MKKIISLAAGCAMTVMSVCSCSGLLDIAPSDRWPVGDIWGSEETLDDYVKRFYVNFRNRSEFYNNNSSPAQSDAYADLMKSTSWDALGGHSYNYANLVATTFNSNGAGPFECWSDQYKLIREVNEFLNDAPTLGTGFSGDYMKQRTAEARFARAYAYYQLCRVYGGVVLRTKLDGPKQNDKARATEAESWNWIVGELKSLAPDLPVSWPAADFGRATQKAAYAFLSRVALYAEAWDDVIMAADKVKELGGALGNYADVFTKDIKNAEICFAVAFKVGAVDHRYDLFMRPPGDGTASKTTIFSAFCPTSELADEFEMADGTPFSWAANGADPYNGRDPRFYATILYNGANWMGRTLETYDGAKPDGFMPWSNTSGQKPYTVSGYYFRKYLTDGATGWTTTNSSQYWILVRYAEVLLNKAEALAGKGGDLPGALAALNEVRQRAGVEMKKRETASYDEFMEYLRHERIVELAGEGLRFWDLRRWKLAVEELNGKAMHGVKITKSGDTFSYAQVEIDGGMKHVFYNRYYNYAIPLDERTDNKLCDNNEGW